VDAGQFDISKHKAKVRELILRKSDGLCFEGFCLFALIAAPESNNQPNEFPDFYLNFSG